MNLKYLTFPLLIDTSLPIPTIIFENREYQVILDELTRDEIEHAFRVRYEDVDGERLITTFFGDGYVQDDNMGYLLNDVKYQLRVVPLTKNAVSPEVKERVALALNVCLGMLDEYVSWQYESFSTIQSRGEYRSYKSTLGVSSLNADHVDSMRNILSYAPSDHLSEAKFKTLAALMYSAAHQGTSVDVSCVLYFSILESLYVKDEGELAYRLAIRISGSLGKDLQYMKRIKTLYGKRGKVIHGSHKGNVFNENDHAELESLAKISFIRFVKDPHLYTQDVLDDNLLSR